MRHLLLIFLFFISLVSYAQEINHLAKILAQLNLDEQKCKVDLIVSKSFPNNTNETIIIIPEIVTEDEGYFELNSHVLIVNTNTGVIKSKYFESSKTNNWVSDAVRLAQIKIDTAPYIITENVRAFGVRVYFYNNSHPNPYSKESFSLYKKEGITLKKVLNNFTIMEYSGETDTTCYGQFTKEEKLLILTKNTTNRYFNILIKNKITTTKNYENDNGECIRAKKAIINKTTLKYDTIEYK